MDLTPARLVLRCFAEKKNESWQAFCLDLTLASQGDSFEEVKAKLEEMIVEYVTDAVSGEDRDHAEALLFRSAPFRFWIKWYFYVALSKIGVVQSEIRRLFTEALPLVPNTHPGRA